MLAREVSKDKAEALEVVCADENVFVVAPVIFDKEKDCYTTDYEKLEAYSNEPSINSLEDLKLTKEKVSK